RARRCLARGPVPGAPRGLLAEQRARDRLDASGYGHGDARGERARSVPHTRPGGVQRRRRGRLGARRAARRRGRGPPPRGGPAPPCAALVKVASLETLTCDAGWRPWIFLKATTDDGLVGWAEITDSHGSPRGLAGVAEGPPPPGRRPPPPPTPLSL